jgi:hypothetical protein
MWYVNNDDECIKHLTSFISKIPKGSRKRIIKMIYLYDLRVEKDFFSFERLFARLRKIFNLKLMDFTHTSGRNGYQFDLIQPTYSLDRNRNRKINKIFRDAKRAK